MREKRILKFDDKTNIVSYIWKEEGQKIRGCIQIVHGMSEHILRFEDLANYFVSKGYVVIGHDHYAHGLSAGSKDKIGIVTDYDFMDAIIKGMKLVRDEYEIYFENTQSCIFAHSMGSMATQRYIELYPNDFEYVILSGTDIGKLKYRFAKILTHRKSKKGEIHYSDFIENLSMGSFNKKYRKEDLEFGWLSENHDNIEAYRNDDLCGVRFPVNYYYSISSLLLEARKIKNLQKIHPSTKFFIYSGLGDPVSCFGDSIKKLKKVYTKLNLRVESKIYPNARHEVHNESNEIKTELYNDIINFLQK